MMRALVYAESVLLVNGSSPTSGYVLAFLNGRWGAISGGSLSSSAIWLGWSSANAQVVCRQLGLQYSGAVNFTAVINNSTTLPYIAASGNSSIIPGPGNRGAYPFIAAYVKCVGSESQLSSCPYMAINPATSYYYLPSSPFDVGKHALILEAQLLILDVFLSIYTKLHDRCFVPSGSSPQASSATSLPSQSTSITLPTPTTYCP